MSLRARVEQFTSDLEEPVVRRAIYEGEYNAGHQDGEDNERRSIAVQLRRILVEDSIEQGEAAIASGKPLVTLDQILGEQS